MRRATLCNGWRIAILSILFATGPLVCLAANVRAADEADKALAAMQGTWEILSFESGTDSAPAGDLVNVRRIVEKTHVVWKDGDKVLLETDIKIDPTARPMTLDSTIAGGDGKGETMQAIYKFEGKELWICFKPPGDGRPSEFFAAPGASQILFKARRIDP
jgi:uncharacterized protein (TIGR03067 family)